MTSWTLAGSIHDVVLHMYVGCREKLHSGPIINPTAVIQVESISVPLRHRALPLCFVQFGLIKCGAGIRGHRLCLQWVDHLIAAGKFLSFPFSLSLPFSFLFLFLFLFFPFSFFFPFFFPYLFLHFFFFFFSFNIL